MHQFHYVKIYSINIDLNLLMLDDPGRVRSQIINVVLILTAIMLCVVCIMHDDSSASLRSRSVNQHEMNRRRYKGKVRPDHQVKDQQAVVSALESTIFMQFCAAYRRTLCEELLEAAGPGMGGWLDQARDTFPRSVCEDGAAGGWRSSERCLRREPTLPSRIRAVRPQIKLTFFKYPSYSSFCVYLRFINSCSIPRGDSRWLKIPNSRTKFRILFF